MITVEEYEKMESDSVPYTTAWGFTVDNLKVNCPDCENTADGLKFKLNEFPNVLEIKGFGVCHNCRTVISGHITRVYKDGRITWRNNKGHWVQRRATLWERIRKWLRF